MHELFGGAFWQPCCGDSNISVGGVQARVNTGDVLRAEIEAGSELGKEAQTHMASGGLVPDQLIIDMVLGKIKAIQDQGKHVLLDGFPRRRS